MSGTSAAELVIILILAIVIVSPLLIIAVSKICCNVLTFYTDLKSEKRRRRNNSPIASTRSDFSSTVKSEKLALIDSSARLERETGIRLDDYPFAVDYNLPLVVVPGANSGILAAGMPFNRYRRQSHISADSDITDDSQALGSDSPGSELFSDSHLPASPMEEDTAELFAYQPHRPAPADEGIVVGGDDQLSSTADDAQGQRSSCDSSHEEENSSDVTRDTDVHSEGPPEVLSSNSDNGAYGYQ